MHYYMYMTSVLLLSVGHWIRPCSASWWWRSSGYFEAGKYYTQYMDNFGSKCCNQCCNFGIWL